MSVKFEKLKLPSYGQMGGVAFHCSDQQLTANGPRVLLFGGQRQGISGAMYSFEQASGDGWIQLADGPEGGGPPPAPRTQSTLTSIGVEPQTMLILFGGYALNIGCMQDLWRCTMTMDPIASVPVPVWEELEGSGTPPCKRYGHSASYFRGKNTIAIFGGQDTVTQYNDLFLLDPDTGTWSTPSVSGPVPSPRVKHSATPIDASRVFFFGGFNTKERVLADAFMLELGDGGTVTWVQMAPEPPVGSKSIAPRAQHAAASTQDGRYVYIHGGYDGTKCLSDFWLLDLQTQMLRSLTVETPAPETRSRHTLHMIGDLLHMFAGYDGSKPVSGDVYTLDCSDPASQQEAEGSGDGKKKEEAKEEEED